MKLPEIAIAVIFVFLVGCIGFITIGTCVGTAKVDAFSVQLPDILKTVDGWDSIKDDPDLKITKFWGVYYVGTEDTRPYPFDGRRAWMARTWQMDEGLKPILDNFIAAQEESN